jgi:cobalt-zinc-cadmium resistance protein CzcA
VENCLRRLAEQQHRLGRMPTLAERLDTVMASAKEMVRPSVFGQAIIITVYLPILTLTGVEGKMFRPMALTVILALAAAFVLSLTFIPAMVAIVIRGRVKEQENFLIRWVKRGYEPSLKLGLRLRYAVVAGAVLLFGLSILLFTRLGQEFVPTLDEQDVAIHAMRIPSTSLTQSSAMQFDVERTISSFPEVQFVFSKTGTAEMAADPMPPNVSDTFIILKPQSAWRSEAELDRLIRQREEEGHGVDHDPASELKVTGIKAKLVRLIELEVKRLPGNNYEFTQPIQMRFNELIGGVRSDVAVKVRGDDFGRMRETARDVARVLQGTPGAADVKVEETEGLPVMSITPDMDAVSRFGLSVRDVLDVVAAALGGREAGQVFEGDRRFDLVVRLPESVRSDLSAIESLPIPLPDDETDRAAVALASARQGSPVAAPRFVSLGDVADIDVAEGPNQISRENGKRQVVVQANVRGRDIGGFVADARKRITGGVKLPAATWLDWGGQFENLTAARRRLVIVVPVCFFLIFLLLFSTFNSVKYALMVFSGVPLALTGGIVALWLRDMPFSISAAVGFIALSGVAVLNGLVMVSYINQLRAEGVELDDAIGRGSVTRLRPVLMTALVASLGFVPMALATGTGAEVQKPLATVVIGGIISSTFLTLIVLPALYRLWNRPRVAAAIDG